MTTNVKSNVYCTFCVCILFFLVFCCFFFRLVRRYLIHTVQKIKNEKNVFAVHKKHVEKQKRKEKIVKESCKFPSKVATVNAQQQNKAPMTKATEKNHKLPYTCTTPHNTNSNVPNIKKMSRKITFVCVFLCCSFFCSSYYYFRLAIANFICSPLFFGHTI